MGLGQKKQKQKENSPGECPRNRDTLIHTFWDFLKTTKLEAMTYM